jgi:hypothetical protein
MVMVLLIALLMLIASAGVLLEASMNTANVTDATADQQAYNAAESGIQSAVQVLRGYTVPSPLLVPTASPTDARNAITYQKAITLGTSNYTNDPSTDARLSRWLNYNYTPQGSTVPDRVTVGPGTYNPDSGSAFSVTVRDPDNTGTTLTYNTTATIDGVAGPMTWGSSGKTATLRFIPKTSTTINATNGFANSDLGTWEFSQTGGGASINKETRFVISLNMTAPYVATRLIGGYIEPGTISNTSVGTVKIRYDTELMILMGSQFQFVGGTFISQFTKPIKVGYQITPNAPNVNGGRTVIGAAITPCEPVRVVVRSTGYGPRGAKKVLEAIVQKNYFSGEAAPATINLIGGTSGFLFDPGTSQNITYSGDDVVSNFMAAPIGVTNDTNLASVNTAIAAFNGDVIGTPENITPELPTWLQSPLNLDLAIRALRSVARSSGGYYTTATLPKKFGNLTSSKGITFLEGNGKLSGDGGGILVCTGTLELQGPVNFNGLVIVTGAGGLLRSGTGNSVMQGNVVIAPYTATNLAAGFGAPKYDLSGGGSSSLIYNSSTVFNGMLAVSNFVLGVGEK